MKTRMAYEIKMDVDTLQKMIAAVNNAKECMTEGQMFTITVSPNVDFKFENLKSFSSTTATSRESAPSSEQTQVV